ncbi:hypothetical protein SAMN02745823_03808 [Sporobacter termitidis DSM 10068]|uniref:Uncharacterized protein n=1 Tax=Sporobacter termitidis DSM 10068 TaxID=1123282 RepID=A0A1M5ZJP0_9FIRM|nr:hypothetical protein SAMN02745823_03808 [Sporobacter termitidis DSM 10068]
MGPTKDQIVHELAMACVNGIVHDKVLKENRESEYGITSIHDLVTDVILAYKEAYETIDPQIIITDD